MSRPLTGRIVANPCGTFTVSVPRAHGSGKRKQATFDTRAAAERWVRACLVALQAGQPLPGAGWSRAGSRVATAVLGTGFKPTGEDFVRERYVEDGHGDIGRELQVLGYINVIDEYMRWKRLTLEAITRKDARKMFNHLRKTDATPTAKFPSELDPDILVTKRDGRALLEAQGHPASDSTFKRALRQGLLAPADTSGRAHRFRLGDLFDPDAGLVNRRAAVATSSAPVGGRYGHTTLAEVRRTFIAVLDYAESEGISLQPKVRDANLPKDKTRKVKTRALTLAEAARVASRLHVVHQLVLWMLRLLGLRLGEVFGVLVEDIIDAGPGKPGLLTVQSQGGTKFQRRQDDGSIEVTDSVDDVKRDSWRVLVVPDLLMVIIRAIIEVFHTDPDGAVRTKARLVPGLVEADKSGQSAFREALRIAAAAEGLDLTFEKRRSAQKNGPRLVKLTPKHMRKSFATALPAGNEMIENIRAVMGHERGTEVIHEDYLLEDLELKPQAAIAEALSAQILTEIPSGLMIRTTISCTTGNQRELARRRAEIDSALIEMGWVAVGASANEGLGVDDAAALQGVSPEYIRELIRRGQLTATKISRTDQGGSRYLIAVADALASRDERSGRFSMRELAAELEVSYDTIRQYIRRHPDLECEPFGDRDHHVPQDVAMQVRAYFLEQRELEARTVRMPEVSRQLDLSVAAIGTLIKHGRLVEDERFHGGIRSVTRASLEAHHRTLSGRQKRA